MDSGQSGVVQLDDLGIPTVQDQAESDGSRGLGRSAGGDVVFRVRDHPALRQAEGSLADAGQGSAAHRYAPATLSTFSTCGRLQRQHELDQVVDFLVRRTIAGVALEAVPAFNE